MAACGDSIDLVVHNKPWLVVHRSLRPPRWTPRLVLLTFTIFDRAISASVSDCLSVKTATT